jgi:PAS domain S-box-containing protein
MNYSSCTLLVIEDFAPDRELYRRCLLSDPSSDYSLLEVESAEAGLELCRTQTIDAILLDYLLPDADGLAFLEALNAQQNRVIPPVVMVTGEGDEIIAARAMKLGAEDYLIKRALTPDLLRLTMRTAIENARLRLQLQESEANLRDSIERERIVHRITLQIRQSLNPTEVLTTAVREVRQFLAADRAFIYRFNADFSGKIVVESVGEEWVSALDDEVEDTYFMETRGEDYRQGRIQIVEDIYTADLTECHREMLQRFQIRANLVVPILQGEYLWGLLALNQCDRARRWQLSDIELTQQLAAQIGIAIHQAELHQQIQESRERLELSIEGTQQGMWDYNLAAHQAYWSPQCKRLFGLEPDDSPVTNEQFFACLHPWDRDRVAAAVSSVCQTYENYDIEYRSVWADGSIHWLHARGKVLRDRHDQPSHILGTVMDISDRKHTEAALRESEQRFRELFNTTYQFIGLLSPDGILLEANQTALDFGGLTREDVVGRPFWEVRWWQISPQTQQQLQDAIRRASQGEFVRYEVEVLGAGDVTTTIDFSLKPLRDSSGQVVLLIPEGRDVSDRLRYEDDRNRIEEALRRNIERFELAVAAVNCLIYDYDVQQNVIERSQGLTQLFGYSLAESEPTADWWYSLIHPSQRLLLQSCKQDIALSTEPSYCFEYQVRHRDGHYVWVQDHGFIVRGEAGQAVRIVGSTTDISERKRNEQRLRDSEEQLKLGVQVAGVALAHFDYSSNQVTLSPEAARLYGFSPDEWVIARSQIHATFHPEEQAELEQIIQQVLDPNGVGWFDREHRVVWRTGEVRWLRVRKQVFFDRSGPSARPDYAILAAIDITDIKQADAERERLLAMAELARQDAEAANQSKDEFVAVVAHELRSPLNSVAGWAKLLQTRQLDAATMAKALDAISRNTEAQIQLVEDLLDISRIARGTLQIQAAPVNVGDVIEAALDIVRPMAETRRIQLATQLMSTLKMCGDFHRLQQIIVNLLTNAIKFTPEGGQVAIQLATLDSHIELVVRDTGKGISAELLPVIFDRYQQGQQNAGSKDGLGLGLAIVKHLVDLHGGTITAKSAGEGQGATFTVRLPILEASSEGCSDADSQDSTTTALTGVRILLVDDEPDQIEFIQILLEEYGAEIQSATSVATGIEQFIRFKPNLLVSDIGMRDGTGHELLQRIRSMPDGTIPAIALTAYASMSDREQALQSGFQHHIAKPVEPEMLAALLMRLIEEH